MASRTWLAVSLMLFIWFGYMKWFAPLPPPQQPGGETVQSLSSGGTGSELTKKTEGQATGAPSGAGSVFTPIVFKEKIGLVTPKLDLVFASEGAKIVSAKLPHYKESVDKSSDLISLVSADKSTLALGTLFTDPNLSEFSRGSYQVQKMDRSVTFEKQNDGIKIRRQYQVSDQSNFVETTLTLSFKNPGKRDWGNLYIPVGTFGAEVFEPHTPLKSWEVVSYQNEEIQRVTLEKLRKNDEHTNQGHTEWLAFGNRYFATAVIPENPPINPDIVYKKTEGFHGAYLNFPLVLKEGQNELSFAIKFYIGPKDYQDLAKVAGLKKLIDYGMFTVFAYPLLEVLRFFYKFIHNFGIAIILLTILVRVLFYPLSQKSMKSMKAMQKLQPKIAALKEKYKEDQKRLNEEQMALFKAHNVNPAGGCLPMLIQMPVFIALYAVLGNSIELFQAPFFGWIHDLSTKDPFYVYPILMGLAMLAQQKLTPSAGMDPAQQKIMYFMPVIFTIMMINLPSGLTLYIFVSTVLGVLQQVAMREKKEEASQIG